MSLCWCRDSVCLCADRPAARTAPSRHALLTLRHVTRGSRIEITVFHSPRHTGLGGRVAAIDPHHHWAASGAE